MNRIPQHIAIIMDGNGRWAMERGKDRSFGHQAGVDAVRRITSECTRLGVKFLTLYTFSTENWNRPADEVAALMGLVLTSLEDEIFMKNNVRFRVVGDRSRIPEVVNKKLAETEEHTAKNDSMTMVVALSYSSKLELTTATKQIAQEVKEGKLDPEQIDEKLFQEHLDTAGLPDVDLMIRTSGEQRLSNYLLYENAYAEFVFTEVKWPDFGRSALIDCLKEYEGRNRRYGGLKNE